MIQHHDFPAQLSHYVRDKWEYLVAHDTYRLPPLPGAPQLLALLEVAYLAGMETDEARPLRFTLCCTPEVETRNLRQARLGPRARPRVRGDTGDRAGVGVSLSVEVWPFAADRPFDVQEIRRLGAATDLDTSAIWVRFPSEPDAPLSIHGIVSLGSTWADARKAFAYQYESPPEALLVQVPAPGQLKVYQGQFLIASLQSGRIQAGELPSPVGLMGAYPLFEEGYRLLRQEITAPQRQVGVSLYQPHPTPSSHVTYTPDSPSFAAQPSPASRIPGTGQDRDGMRDAAQPGRLGPGEGRSSPRDPEGQGWQETEWLAYVNTVLGIVNAIQMRGHGGALIFAAQDCRLVCDHFVKIKYALAADAYHLKDRFVELMNLRHRLGDLLWVIKTGDDLMPAEEELSLTALLMQNAQRRLAETCRLVGDLSGTDGAVILRTNLFVEGFGAEIRLEALPTGPIPRDSAPRGPAPGGPVRIRIRAGKPAAVYKVTSPIRRDREAFDYEQFGMRHRSAMRLCSALPDLVVFVVSQDGGVSLVWNEGGEVCFKPGINTENANMVFVE
jgi:hypothetical protein